MRPLSEVPISTPPLLAITAKPVTVVELQTMSVPPSGRIRNTALRAFDRSLRLRAGVEAVADIAAASSVADTLTTAAAAAASVAVVAVVLTVAAASPRANA